MASGKLRSQDKAGAPFGIQHEGSQGLYAHPSTHTKERIIDYQRHGSPYISDVSEVRGWRWCCCCILVERAGFQQPASRAPQDLVRLYHVALFVMILGREIHALIPVMVLPGSLHYKAAALALLLQFKTLPAAEDPIRPAVRS